MSPVNETTGRKSKADSPKSNNSIVKNPRYKNATPDMVARALLREPTAKKYKIRPAPPEPKDPC